MFLMYLDVIGEISRLMVLSFLRVFTFLYYYGLIMAHAWGRNYSPLNKSIQKSVLVVIGDFKSLRLIHQRGCSIESLIVIERYV